jgi:serine/threonine-protein kinase
MVERLFAGKYQVVRDLGVEPASRAYLASTVDGDQVVVKVITPADAQAAHVVEQNTDLVSGIRDPALPAIIEWGHEGSDFLVVREFVPGVDLESELVAQRAFAAPAVARYGAMVAGGLDQMHKRGVIHANVRTSNVIRTPEDTVKLVGNSLGLQGAAAEARSAGPPDTALYLAPEQITGSPISPQTDVYGLGVVLYELVTGRLPFTGSTAAAVADQHVHAMPMPVRQLSPSTPASLETVIMKALEKAPEERFASADDMRTELEIIASSYAPAPAAQPKKSGVSAWVWVALGLLLLLIAGAGVAFALGLLGGGVPVPNVVGRPLAQATTTLTTAGLRLGKVSYSGTSVAGVADGSVVSQDPAAGSKVATGTPVSLVIAGQQVIQVPDVTGQSLTQATETLEGVGLVVGTVSRVPTSTAAPDTVLSETPAAGQSVPHGSTVTLSVAAAPVSAQVPNVVGLTSADASSSLSAAGFLVQVQTQSSSTVASGVVISQSPAGGTSSTASSTVTIVVSTGTGVTTAIVPNVVGKTAATAGSDLGIAGFKVATVSQSTTGTAGDVTHQSPAAGDRASIGSTVTITVRK